jgi:hypothetical protein
VGYQIHSRRARRLPNVSVFLSHPTCSTTTSSSDWAGRSMQFADHLELYDHMNARELAAARDGKQGGDPVKGAKAMYELAVMQDPPVGFSAPCWCFHPIRDLQLRCLLGKDAYENMLKKLATYKEQVAKYKDLTLSCQIDE